MYGREIDGRVTTFGTTGYTYNSVFVLYDRETDSIWYPLEDGAFDAIAGPRRGHVLPFLGKPPLMSLAKWRSKHPNTMVLLEDASRLDEQGISITATSRPARRVGVLKNFWSGD